MKLVSNPLRVNWSDVWHPERYRTGDLIRLRLVHDEVHGMAEALTDDERVPTSRRPYHLLSVLLGESRTEDSFLRCSVLLSGLKTFCLFAVQLDIWRTTWS